MIIVKKWMIDIIDECKKSEQFDELVYILRRKEHFKGWAYPLNDMTVEEIVLVWHGHVKAE